jgi:hypothetical protein
MNKFHQIPTDKFVPISHDNSYLFNHYDKVANFLAFNLENNYKNILAKPVQNGYLFDWFSVHENLVNINERNKAEMDTMLLQYWVFIDIVNAKIQQLSNSNDENNKNWANLLTKVFNRQDNFIFSNGKDICIVWGWKFDNNELYRPNILKTPNTFLYPDRNAVSTDIPTGNKSYENESVNNFQEPTIEEESIKEDPIDEIKIIEEIETNKEHFSFLEFLKWFASKYWWFLLIILGLIIVVITYKLLTLTYKINNI